MHLFHVGSFLMLLLVIYSYKFYWIIFRSSVYVQLYAHKNSLIRYASKNKIQQQHHNKSEKNKVTISRVLKHNEAHNKFNLLYWIIIGISAENHLNDNNKKECQPILWLSYYHPNSICFSLSGFFMFLYCYVASKLRVYLYRVLI